MGQRESSNKRSERLEVQNPISSEPHEIERQASLPLNDAIHSNERINKGFPKEIRKSSHKEFFVPRFLQASGYGHAMVPGKSSKLEYGNLDGNEQYYSIRDLHKSTAKTTTIKVAYCDACSSKKFFVSDILFGENLCFICEKYFCNKCFKNHEIHNVIKRHGNEKVNKDTRAIFIKQMLSESLRRKKIIHIKDVSVCERLDFKNNHDKFVSSITGLCGLGIRRWVACDYNNNCVKVFKIGTNECLHYIRFQTDVYGVTQVKHPEYERAYAKDISEGTCTSNSTLSIRTAMNEPCVLAVSLPKEKQIAFLGMNQKPINNIGTINIPEYCFEINFHSETLLVSCKESLYIMTISGTVLKRFDMNQYHHNYHHSSFHFAIGPDRIYIVNMEKEFAYIYNFDFCLKYIRNMERMKPCGITLNEEGDVFVSVGTGRVIYRFGKNFNSIRPIFDTNAVMMSSAALLLHYRDRLYISHARQSVIRLV